jgi:hypothetical protein
MKETEVYESEIFHVDINGFGYMEVGGNYVVVYQDVDNDSLVAWKLIADTHVH